MKYVFTVLVISLGISLAVNGKAPSQENLYQWYVEHYTGLSLEDIAQIKEAHDKNPSLDQDPNIRMGQCNGCELIGLQK